MAGVHKLIYTQEFVNTDTIEIIHNSGYEYLKVKVITGTLHSSGIVKSIITNKSDPTNILTVTLESTQTGSIQLFEIDTIDVGTSSSTELHTVSDSVEEYIVTVSGFLQDNIDEKPTSLIELNDTPSIYDNGKYLQSTAAGSFWASIAGIPGEKGADGGEWISDHGAPTSVTGILNNFYLDVDTGNVYKKTSVTSGTFQYGVMIEREADHGYTFADAIKLVKTGKEQIVDNLDDEFHCTSGWNQFSNGNAWEVSCIYSTSFGSKAYFDINIEESGEYDIYAWWPVYNSAGRDVPFSITHVSGTNIIRKDQHTGSPQWNYLATYSFDGAPVWEYLMTIKGIDGSTTLSGLSDTPDGYDIGKYLRSTSNGSEWYDLTDDFYTELEVDTLIASGIGSGGSSTFIDLIDTPSTYINTEGRYAQSTGSGIVWSTISGVIGNTLPAIQARRTTSYLLTSSYVNITFDITDEETVTSIIEHDNSNTDRINIKCEGTYLIQYNFNVEAPANVAQVSYAEAHLVKNNITTISGSYAKNTVFYDTSIDGNPLFDAQISNSVLVTLNSSDYITLQMKYDDFQTTVASNGTIKVIKLDVINGINGEKGDTGDVGPSGVGSTINISSNNILTASGISNLNFGEEFSVVDNGLGKATVSGGGTGDHGLLSGLLDDDHQQYLPINGSRDMSNDLTVSGTISTTKVFPINDASSYVELESKVISIYADWANMLHISGLAGEIIFNPHANVYDVDVIFYGKNGTETKDAYKYDHGEDIHYFNSNINVSGTISALTPTIDQHLTTKQYVDEVVISGSISNHNELGNLDYVFSGHTGFQPAGNYVVDSELTTLSGNLQSNINDKPDILLDLLDTPITYEDGKYLQSTSSGSDWYDLTDDFYTESEIDTISGSLNSELNDHISNTSNPHSVTLEQTRAEDNIMTGSIVFNPLSNLTCIDISAANRDLTWMLGHNTDGYGYYWQYTGTGVGDANYLYLYSENGAGIDFYHFRYHQTTHVIDVGSRLNINNDYAVQFRDSAIYISSVDDGHLDLSADTSIDLNADTDLTNHSLNNTQRISFEQRTSDVSLIDDGDVWYRNDTENYKARANALIHEIQLVKIIQCYNNITTNCNVTIPVVIPFNGEDFKDDLYTHDLVTNNSRIEVERDGIYKITYQLNFDNVNSNRTTIRSRIRVNGATYLDRGTAHSYMRNSTDDKATNNASILWELSANDYIEIMCDRQGSSGVANTIPNQSSITLNIIRYT